MLKGIYYSIKQEAIPWAPDLEISPEPVSGQPATATAQPQKPARMSLPGSPGEISDLETNGSAPMTPLPIAIGKTAGGVNPFLSAPDQETAVNYKKGYVMRKSCMDPNGKKTKLGKR